MKKKKRKRKRLTRIGWICWVIIPITAAVFLILDGLGFYHFNTERLLVLGGCMLVMLIPFFSEITVHKVSLKKGDGENRGG
ncbi:MAG: hypothetical protein J6Q82_01685 [Clostridia bacterium]|nr:hypothetical protein [Clostridia bacterium]